MSGLPGPSGCSETTIVQAVADHVRPTAGRIVLRGGDVTDTPLEPRNVSAVFRQPTVYPHMIAGETIAYGLAAQDLDRDGRTNVRRTISIWLISTINRIRTPQS
jgi:putative spermidine/putrescine transport system ATP-binding protein/molybdate/tungstate transport system ATP-binding protein